MMASQRTQPAHPPPVHRAFDELSELERRLIALVYWAGLSQAEVAAELDVSLATVKTGTRSALARLADLLEDDRARSRARGDLPDRR